MNSKPYKLIFALLIFSVLAVLILQGFWIRSFYHQKLEEFDKTIYAALEKVTEKLEERQNLKIIKDKVIHESTGGKKQDLKIIKSFSSSSHYSSGINKNRKQDITQIVKVGPGIESSAVTISSDSVFTTTAAPEIRITKNKITAHDSVVSINEPGTLSITQRTPGENGSFVKNTVIINQFSQKKAKNIDPKQNEDINKLMDKMLMEIKIIDTDETNADTLKHVIQKVLENKGIFTPFEFSLKKIITPGKIQVLSQSAHFDSTKASYRSDLSANKIFTTNNFLFLQFPDAGGFVFREMKGIILSSLLFSLIIIIVFYFTIQAILKQKKLGEIKNDFINNMTHELKTPIATMSLAIDAINNPQVKSDHEKFDQYSAIMKEENRKLNNHVERVLQMALIDKGELQLHKKRINLADLIHSAINAHKLQVEYCNGQIIFEAPQTPLFIVADKFHLLAAFNNLLDNALKYSEGNCLVQIEVQQTETMQMITIKDNGIGIDAELHKKVFEKFYRVQGGNLHDVKGFGLGLSYVKSIIESHNGSIELQSEKGKGSTFTIKLPADET